MQDVLLALSEEVHRVEAEKKGATIELPLYFQAKVSCVRSSITSTRIAPDMLHGNTFPFPEGRSPSV